VPTVIERSVTLKLRTNNGDAAGLLFTRPTETASSADSVIPFAITLAASAAQMKYSYSAFVVRPARAKLHVTLSPPLVPLTPVKAAVEPLTLYHIFAPATAVLSVIVAVNVGDVEEVFVYGT